MKARTWLVALGLGGLLATACGVETTCVLVEVRWQGYLVPADLDTLHFALADADGPFVERSLAIPADAPPATLELCRGPRTPLRLGLVVHGLRADTQVTHAPAVDVDFTADQDTVHSELP